MVIFIFMGVMGCGKTTIGKIISEKINFQFFDADNFHSEKNKEKMKKGIPLNDEDRIPWLNSLHFEIKKWVNNQENCILACSALKKTYRDLLRLEENHFPNHLFFIYLKTNQKEIEKRLKIRQSHEFMNDNLLFSQFQTLEEPNLQKEKDILIIDTNEKDKNQIVNEIIIEIQNIIKNI